MTSLPGPRVKEDSSISAKSSKRYGARRADPAAHYQDPAAVVTDYSMTRTQRLQLLHDWAQDLIDHQIASGEGMLHASPGLDARLLRQINVCIETVEATPEDPVNHFVRLWRLLLAR